MEKVLNTLINILEYAEFRDNALETAEYIGELEDIAMLKDLFEILDVEMDEEEYMEYIAENLEELLKEIDEYYTFRQAERHEIGLDLFERQFERDDNTYYASEDDLLGNDWDDLYKYEEELHTEQHGCIIHGTRPSEKKDRQQVVWKEKDLEGDFVDAIDAIEG